MDHILLHFSMEDATEHELTLRPFSNWQNNSKTNVSREFSEQLHSTCISCWLL
jgi:hypothetical protein